MMLEPKEEKASSPTTSTKERNEPELFGLIRKLLDPKGRRELGKGFLQGILWWCAFVSAIAVPSSIGEMLAVGVSRTVARRGGDLLKLLVIGPGIVVLVVLVTGVLGVMVWCAKAGIRALLNRLPESSRRTVTTVAWNVGLLVGCGGLAFTCAREAYRSALRADPPVTSADRKTIEETREAAQKQSEAIKKFSETADALLKDLDRTAGKVAETKQEITQTMALFEKQLQATQEAQSNLARLAERQRVIETREVEIERILNGKVPITREDLDQSGRTGLWQGFLSGIVTSLIATGILGGFGRLRATFRRRPEDAAPDRDAAA